MKILMVNRGIFPVPWDRGGGAEWRCYKLANALGELGHKVHLVTNTTDSKSFHSNVMIHKLRTPSFKQKSGICGYALNHLVGNLSVVEKTCSLLLEKLHRFDVIHCHGALSALLLSRIRKHHPIIYTAHDPTPYLCHYEGQLEQLIRKTHFRLIDVNTWWRVNRIVSTNTAIKNEIVRWGVPLEKINVVYSGVDTVFFKAPDFSESNEQKRYCLENGYCLFVGRLTRRKGVRYILQSLVNTKASCVIVGDGPEREKLEQLSRRLKISDRVLFTGFVPVQELRKWYVNAGFFVFPSVADAFPLSILEAMSSGLPVIASRIPGLDEIVVDNYNGFTVSPGNVEAFESRIEVLSEDTSLQRKMGDNARRMMERKFSWQKTANQTAKVYEEAISQEAY